MPTTTTTPDLLTEGLAAHARGWNVTPLDGKRPILLGWQRGLPVTPDMIRRWVAEGYNLGIVCGAPSGGLVVIDIDPAHGGTVPAELKDVATVTAITGGGGLHIYLRAPADVKVGCSVGTLAPGVDVKGDGGLVVLPGSIHPDTGKVYTWVTA